MDWRYPMATVRTKATNEPYHRGNVRADLIKEGIKLLRAESVSAISVRRLAREIDVAPSAVYNHFENREELLAAIAAEGFRQIAKVHHKALSAGGSTDNVLKEMMRAFLVFVNKNRDLYDLMYSYEVTDHRKYPELSEAADRSFQLVVQQFYPDEEYDSGESASNYPAALAFWAACNGLGNIVARKQITLKKYDKPELETLADDYIEILLQGLPT